ncbi:MAG: LAO/AO transport system kinase [Cyclobacteriaceae bacterium]|jgi:LAO/AO transport system kinase
MSEKVQNKFSTQNLINGIYDGNRLMLSKAITLIESKKPDDQSQARFLIDSIILKQTKSLRIGITGVPGVGKSTFIESLGLYAIGNGKKVAVLSVDPSSTISKGSILGDKTRMTNLSQHELAFIRPSPSGNFTGGVAQKTRETILLCEAAGFDIIIIETMGVGQAEVMVKEMVDFYLVLMLAGGGDELQGIKRGITELADAIAINKADGDNYQNSLIAKKSFENALHYFPEHENGWIVPVNICSALENIGIDIIWETVSSFRKLTNTNGWFQKNRQEQNVHWMNELIESRLKEEFYNKPEIKVLLNSITASVKSGIISVRSALNQIFES